MPFIEKRVITEEDFDHKITPFKKDMMIWKVGLFYGSMVYFQMGEKRLSETNTERGEFTLILNCDEWYLEKNNQEICNSFHITREFAETSLNQMMIGAKFDDIIIDVPNNMTMIYFDQAFRIKLIHENVEMNEHDLLFSLHLPKRECISLQQGRLPKLEIEIDKQD